MFDVLGEVFEDKSLKDLLIEAIRYGDDPEIRARLQRKIEGALDTQRLEAIIKRNALCEEVMDERHLFAVKEEMEKAEARKLQPYFIRAFFNQAFQQLGGELRGREPGRWEITNVLAIIRERDRRIAGRDRRNPDPVLRRYERVCFEKHYVRLVDRVGAPMASLIHPGHPLMQSVTDIVLEQHRNKLKQGAVLVDSGDSGLTPKVMFIIDHAVKEGSDSNRIVSRRIHFIAVSPTALENGSGVNVENAGWAPHLDLEALDEVDRPLIQDVLDAPWLNSPVPAVERGQGVRANLEQQAIAHASTHLVPEHFAEVRNRREHSVDKTLRAVHERLVKEINFWSDRYMKLKDDMAAGKDVRLTLENVRRTIDDLTARREAREKELLDMRHVISATPVVIGGALVIPAGLLAQRKGQPGWTADADARSRVERIAMHAVIAHEQALGHEVFDVSDQKCGWDVTSLSKSIDSKPSSTRHIEVKGRAKGQNTITVTRNEILYGLNQADKFILAIVLVDGGQHEGPYYLKNPFTREPDWAVTSINLDLYELLARAE